MPSQRRRRRNFDPDVLERIHELALMETSGRAIRAALIDEGLREERIPSERTIQSIMKEAAGSDRSAVWATEDALEEPDTARHLLDVLAAVIDATRGRRRHLTNREADKLSRLRVLAPSLQGWASYVLCRYYLARADRGAPTDDLDWLLAYQPWHSNEHRDRYATAVTRGWVPEAPRPAVDGGVGVTDACYGLATHWLRQNQAAVSAWLAAGLTELRILEVLTGCFEESVETRTHEQFEETGSLTPAKYSRPDVEKCARQILDGKANALRG